MNSQWGLDVLNFGSHSRCLSLIPASVPSDLTQDPVLSAEDIARLSCRANNRMPLSVLKKVGRELMCDKLLLTILPLHWEQSESLFVMTATKTHHLLSAELCEHGDQPVSTQRGGGAASTDADTHKGKTNGE